MIDLYKVKKIDKKENGREGRAQRVWKVWKEKDDDQADLVATYTIKELEKIKRRILKMILWEVQFILFIF